MTYTNPLDAIHAADFRAELAERPMAVIACNDGYKVAPMTKANRGKALEVCHPVSKLDKYFEAE